MSFVLGMLQTLFEMTNFVPKVMHILVLCARKLIRIFPQNVEIHLYLNKLDGGVSRITQKLLNELPPNLDWRMGLSPELST